jgi:capsular polysaccharide biosynthesis protein
VRRRVNCPSETLISISPIQYAVFKYKTIIDCNTVFEKTIDQLVEKLSQGKLQSKDEMDQRVVCKLREGVIASPLIEECIKELLKS